MNKNKMKLFTYLEKINPELGKKAYVKFIWGEGGSKEQRNVLSISPLTSCIQ
jgi:hypothetical protein